MGPHPAVAVARAAVGVEVAVGQIDIGLVIQPVLPSLFRLPFEARITVAACLRSQHTIAGTVLTMPVRIRKADVHTAMFSVPADAAQRLIDYSGLQVCQFRPGRAVVTLMLARYLDGDLGRYNEFGTCVMVNPPGSTAPAA